MKCTVFFWPSIVTENASNKTSVERKPINFVCRIIFKTFCRIQLSSLQSIQLRMAERSQSICWQWRLSARVFITSVRFVSASFLLFFFKPALSVNNNTVEPWHPLGIFRLPAHKLVFFQVFQLRQYLVSSCTCEFNHVTALPRVIHENS